MIYVLGLVVVAFISGVVLTHVYPCKKCVDGKICSECDDGHPDFGP